MGSTVTQSHPAKQWPVGNWIRTRPPRQGLCPPHAGPSHLDTCCLQLDTGTSLSPSESISRVRGPPSNGRPGRGLGMRFGLPECRTESCALPARGSAPRCTGFSTSEARKPEFPAERPWLHQAGCPLAGSRQTMSPGCWATSGESVKTEAARGPVRRDGKYWVHSRPAAGEVSRPGDPGPTPRPPDQSSGRSGAGASSRSLGPRQ